jgi:hypothetical protein
MTKTTKKATMQIQDRIFSMQTCPVCSTRFKPKQLSQIYCGTPCRRRNNTRKVNEGRRLLNELRKKTATQ